MKYLGFWVPEVFAWLYLFHPKTNTTLIQGFGLIASGVIFAIGTFMVNWPDVIHWAFTVILALGIMFFYIVYPELDKLFPPKESEAVQNT